MNPEEFFSIARVFKNKIDKHHNMKPTYTNAYDFLKALVCDFAKIDVEIYPILLEKMDFPPFNMLHVSVKEFKS